MIRSSIPSLVALTLGCTLACTTQDRSPGSAPAQPAPSQEPAVKAAPAPAHPTQPAAAPASSGGLHFTAQAGWIEETPTSAMRKAQYRLPGEHGADATLVVYNFGPGGGGGVEANVARWAGQFEQPDGSDSRAAMKSSKRTIGGIAATEVDLAGTYVAETSPGSGEHVREEGWRMKAAILEASEGAYYVKLVGPAATLARWESSYASFLEGVGR